MFFFYFLIVIDSDRGQCHEHLKKIKLIEPVTCIWMFGYAINFELPEMAKKWNFGLFRPNLPQLGLFHPYFACKNSFRVISMIKMVIWDESKPISLILKDKNFKIQNLSITRLLLIKTEIRQVYDPF